MCGALEVAVVAREKETEKGIRERGKLSNHICNITGQ